MPPSLRPVPRDAASRAVVTCRRTWLTALVAMLVLGAVLTAQASAATYDVRYTTNTNGAIAMAANTVMACPAGGACTTAQNTGTGQNVADGALDNNAYTMGYVNVDPSGHFDS